VVLNLRLLPAAHHKPNQPRNHQHCARYHEPVGQQQPFHGGRGNIHLILREFDQAVLRLSHIAGFRLAIARNGTFEGEPIADFDSIGIYSRTFQLIDVQKHIRSAGVICDETETSIGIPHFQFAGAHPISLFSVRARPGGGWLRSD
jgi:hypothetical protein